MPRVITLVWLEVDITMHKSIKGTDGKWRIANDEQIKDGRGPLEHVIYRNGTIELRGNKTEDIVLVGQMVLDENMILYNCEDNVKAVQLLCIIWLIIIILLKKITMNRLNIIKWQWIMVMISSQLNHH